MLICHPSKYEVNPTYGLGGVWRHTDTHTHTNTHTQTGYGDRRIDTYSGTECVNECICIIFNLSDTFSIHTHCLPNNVSPDLPHLSIWYIFLYTVWGNKKNMFLVFNSSIHATLSHYLSGHSPYIIDDSPKMKYLPGNDSEKLLYVPYLGHFFCVYILYKFSTCNEKYLYDHLCTILIKTILSFIQYSNISPLF